MSPAYLSARPGGGKGQCCPILVSLGSELLLSLQPRGRWAGISLLTGCSLPLEAACFIAQKLADESWRLPRMDPTSPCSALEPPGEGDRDLVCPCLVKHLEPLVHSPREWLVVFPEPSAVCLPPSEVAGSAAHLLCPARHEEENHLPPSGVYTLLMQPINTAA